MFLRPGTLDERLYAGQEYIQVILLSVALFQVPILLLLKPFFLRWKHNRTRDLGYHGISETSRFSALDGDNENEPLVDRSGNSFSDDGEGVTINTQNISKDQPFEFSEVIIYQVIDTISKLQLCL